MILNSFKYLFASKTKISGNQFINKYLSHYKYQDLLKGAMKTTLVVLLLQYWCANSRHFPMFQDPLAFELVP